jgi:hypothetical protein
MVVKDGTWYWFAAGYGGCPERLGPSGATGPTGCAGGFKGCGFFNNHTVNLFTSTDLVTWTPHGNVLPEANRVDAILFSPKVLFNAKTQTWVLWYNFVPHYSYGVATSKSAFGPFKTVNATAGSSFRFGFPGPGHPANSDIGDFSLWADDDGTAYFLYSSHAHCQIERLTDDYLASTWETTNQSSLVFPHGNEAPALFKRKGLWYALVSESCCYCKAGGKVHAYSSKRPLGPYDYLGEITAGPNPFGGTIATASQETNVFPVALASGETAFVWQGDRWQSAPDKLKSHDFTYWYQLQFDAANGSSVKRISWVDSFTLELKDAEAAAAAKSDANAAARSAPCDIYAAAGTPCAAAHSMGRALYSDMIGSLP